MACRMLAMKTMLCLIAIGLCLLLFGASGCTSLAPVAHELAGDTNRFSVSITTPWGHAELHRNDSP